MWEESRVSKTNKNKTRAFYNKAHRSFNLRLSSSFHFLPILLFCKLLRSHKSDPTVNLIDIYWGNHPGFFCCCGALFLYPFVVKMGKIYVQTTSPTDLNKNTEWFMYPGVWTTYILIVFFSWLLVLSIFGCSLGMAWTIINLSHFLVSYKNHPLWISLDPRKFLLCNFFAQF